MIYPNDSCSLLLHFQPLRNKLSDEFHSVTSSVFCNSEFNEGLFSVISKYIFTLSYPS